MSTGIKERTIEFVKFKGMTMKSFEQRCDLSSGYVTSMRKGFGIDKLNNVLTAFPELNREWLLYGEGEMLNTHQEPPTLDQSETPETLLATLALGMQEERRRHDKHIAELLSQQNELIGQQKNLIGQQERLIALLEKAQTNK